MTLLHDLRLLMFAVTLKEIGKWSDEQKLESSRTFRSFTVCGEFVRTTSRMLPFLCVGEFMHCFSPRSLNRPRNFCSSWLFDWFVGWFDGLLAG